MSIECADADADAGGRAGGVACSRWWAVVRCAVLSRAVVLALGAVARAVVDDYDASARLVLADGGPAAVRAAAHMVLRWDAFYFVHIANGGYVYEQEHAFFPLLPVLMRLAADTVLAPVAAVAGKPAAVALAGAAVSNVCFVLAAAALYELGCRTLGDERLAYIAALLFAWAPSSMFMSAAYTESLFAWLVFTALVCAARRQHVRAALWLCASGLCRANGVAYAGFLVWDVAVRRGALRGRGAVLRGAARAAVLTALAALGFGAFQAYGYRLFCEQARTPRPYCARALPLVYSFVQSAYWDVGLLRYYTWQQLPNFLLAAPMVVLSAAGLAAYALHDPLRLATLGRRRSRRRCDQARPPAFFGDALLPHVYLWALLLAVATTTMHVQVITRFFSSVPAVFWFAAHVVAGGGRGARRAVAGYFAGYGLAGVVLFSCFFPPA
ncbi:ER membrane glycoprotein subunit of the GPI transamidase complex-like protein [Coemansia biformis]|uniref:GPI mannosyltransferase 2 n=1 Tax=Coemansia biformis TaxID=1286918 RepID=A0A9W7YA49_9FUNG|nr:ER membrane glycoprotein subunit of the GPI transamidase complex-like protein [Coemansia biformis]